MAVVRVVLVLVVQLRLLAEARLTLLLQVVLCALPLAMVHLVVIFACSLQGSLQLSAANFL